MYAHDAGVAVMTELLDRSPDLDAVFVASDLLAAGACHASFVTCTELVVDGGFSTR